MLSSIPTPAPALIPVRPHSHSISRMASFQALWKRTTRCIVFGETPPGHPLGHRAVAEPTGVCPACCRLSWVQVPAETSEAAVSFVHRFAGAQLALPSMPTAAALPCSSLSGPSLEKPKRSDSTLQTGGIALLCGTCVPVSLPGVSTTDRQTPASLPARRAARVPGPRRRPQSPREPGLPFARPLPRSSGHRTAFPAHGERAVQVTCQQRAAGPRGAGRTPPAP